MLPSARVHVRLHEDAVLVLGLEHAHQRTAKQLRTEERDTPAAGMNRSVLVKELKRLGDVNGSQHVAC